MSDGISVFALNGCDWVAARSLDEAKAFYIDYAGPLESDFELDPPRQLTAEEMGRLKFRDTDEDDNPLETTRTFREQLDTMIAEGEPFPAFFASTEY